MKQGVLSWVLEEPRNVNQCGVRGGTFQVGRMACARRGEERQESRGVANRLARLRNEVGKDSGHLERKSGQEESGQPPG